jgi:head-tail adaptor
MADELAGALDERVAIENWIDARDDAGGYAGHWQLMGSAWAAVLPDGGGRVAGEARQSSRRWRVTLRAPATIGAPVSLATRLIWRGAALAILAVEADPRVPDRVMLRCEARQQ